MLQKNMEEIAVCAAQEVSCLGSSIESLEEQFSDMDEDVSHSSEDLMDIERTTAEEEEREEEEEEEQPKHDREMRNPLSWQSMQSHKSDCDGFRTPPYLSPGVTRRIQWKNNGFETKL